MKTLKSLFGILVFGIFAFTMQTTVQAQTSSSTQTTTVSVPAVAQLAVAEASGGTTAIASAFTATSAGNPLAAPAVTTSNYLNYTSTVASGTTRTISVALSGAVLAPGTQITILAAPASANTATGTEGTAASTATFVTATTLATEQNLITAIGNCATGTDSDGVQLTYTVTLESAKAVDAGVTAGNALIATYTMSDDS